MLVYMVLSMLELLVMLLGKVMLVVVLLLLLLLLLLEPPSIHHGMFRHRGLSQTVAVGLNGRDIPPGIWPCSNDVINLHRPCMASEI